MDTSWPQALFAWPESVAGLFGEWLKGLAGISFQPENELLNFSLDDNYLSQNGIQILSFSWS